MGYDPSATRLTHATAGAPTLGCPCRPRLRRAAIAGRTIDILVDLAGDALCLPHDADVCRARRMFNRLDPGDLAIGGIEVGPMPPGSEVRFADEAGNLSFEDVSDRPRRVFTFQWIDDGRGFKGNPCIARFDGIEARDLADLRLRLSGQRAAKVGSLPDGRALSIAALGDLVIVGDTKGLRTIDWTDPERPLELSRFSLDNVSAAFIVGNRAGLVAGGETVLVDLADPASPRALRWQSGEVGLVALAADAVHLLTGRRLVVRAWTSGELRSSAEFDASISAHHLAVTKHGVVVAEARRLLLLSEDGSVLASRGLADPIQRLEAVSHSVSITSVRGTETLRVDAQGFHLLTRYARPHWSTTFAAVGPSERLFRIGEDERVELWRLRPHALRREDYRDAFELGVSTASDLETD